jgi:hypothetical protein
MLHNALMWDKTGQLLHQAMIMYEEMQGQWIMRWDDYFTWQSPAQISLEPLQKICVGTIKYVWPHIFLCWVFMSLTREMCEQKNV